jgi:hypothetical protein
LKLYKRKKQEFAISITSHERFIIRKIIQFTIIPWAVITSLICWVKYDYYGHWHEGAARVLAINTFKLTDSSRYLTLRLRFEITEGIAKFKLHTDDYYLPPQEYERRVFAENTHVNQHIKIWVNNKNPEIYDFEITKPKKPNNFQLGLTALFALLSLTALTIALFSKKIETHKV